jgi:hypothetical protein
MKLTRQNIKKLLPPDIQHLSLGATHCSYILNGELVSTPYSELIGV